MTDGDIGMTDEEFERMYEAATAAGRRMQQDPNLGASVSYDAKAEAIRIELRSGVEVVIPARLIEGLPDASHAQRAEVEMTESGYGLHWPALDLDLSVPGLLAGVFGTRAWMDRLRAAHAGKATSPAKAAAARANGAKGGRPRKTVA